MGLPWDGPAGPFFTWGEGFSANAPSCVWHILLALSRGGPGHPPYSNFGVWEGSHPACPPLSRGPRPSSEGGTWTVGAKGGIAGGWGCPGD